MKIFVNKAHYPVTVLGPGKRIGIWLQGCSIRCRGCVSTDTWNQDASFECYVDTIVQWCRSVSRDGLDGITISGGEPFDQPESLCALLDCLANWRSSEGLEFDVLCYSGYSQRHLRKHHSTLLTKLDAVIPEPYKDKLEEGACWRGSANQKLIPLSERGQKVYGNLVSRDSTLQKRFQIVVDEQNVWFVGIPMRGDMQRLESVCKDAGLKFGQPSWRA